MDIKKYYTTFNELNANFWCTDSSDSAKPGILVYAGTPYPTGIIECMLLAKKLSARNHQKIDVIFDDSHDNQCEVYKSFNINNIFILKKASVLSKSFYLFKILAMFFKLKNADELLNFTYKSVPLGEILYDHIIRTNANEYTITELKPKYIRSIYSILRKFDEAERILCRGKYDTLIYCDGDYDRQSFGKVAQKYGVKLIQAHHGRVIIHNENDDYKIYHNSHIPFSLYESNVKSVSQDVINDYVNLHFTGKDEENLDRNAYYAKKNYTLKELIAKVHALDGNGEKNVLVAAHAFSDLPHYGKNMIYHDYYEWLVETLKILSIVKGVNVFVKEHPSAMIYGEKGSVKYIVEKNKLKNIYVIPDDLNTRCLFDIMDYVVTCQGTIGLEATLFGLPVFTASQGYYHHFGIGINSTSKEEYESRLKNILSYGKNDVSNREMASRLIYICYNQIRFPSPEVYPEHRFMDNDVHRTSIEYQYNWINNKLAAGANMKDEFYQSILQERVIEYETI